MISENDKNEMCRMRRLGFTLDYIAKATGYSASSVANVTACVERPLASSGKDKQIEAMIHILSDSLGTDPYGLLYRGCC